MRDTDQDFLPTTRETLYDLAYDTFSLFAMGAFLLTVLFWAPEFIHWLHG